MMSLHQIESMYRNRRFDQLLTALAVNGLPVPMPLQVRLADLPTAAVALGLKRLVELTYGPTPTAREMLTDLLQRQQPDGSFDGSPIATAAVVAALDHIRRQQPRLAHEPTLAAALEQASHWLMGRQGEDGLIGGSADRHADDRALVTAFVLFLVGRVEAFRSAVRLADLLNWFELHQSRLSPEVDRLWHLAMARESTTASPKRSRPRHASAA